MSFMPMNREPEKLLPGGWPDISIKVDEYSAPSLFVGGVLKPNVMEGRLMKRNDYWHTFVIVGGCKYYRDFVLKLIIEAAYPFDFIPVKYVKIDPDTCFMVKGCARAIEQLCLLGLVIRNPHGENIRLQLVLASIHQTSCNVNVGELLKMVVTKRYDANQKMLNLKDFHNDPDLVEVFCPLSSPRILLQVNDQVFAALGSLNFTSISLANNELSSLRSLEPLCVFASKLRTLNLSYNKFANIDDLEVLRRIPLWELSLDSNPLCQRFDDEATYVKKVRQYFPSLKVLDGIELGGSGVPQIRRNYLVAPLAGPLTDQFLRHFFDMYDFDRAKLIKCYHPAAMFSLTATYIPGQSTSSNARLSQYTSESRNLLKLSDYSKTQQTLYRGKNNIVAFLTKLPKTEHDPVSFSVDTPVYTGETAVVNVSGVFQEPDDLNLLRSFSRVFVLVRVGGQEWQIANDCLSVSNACTGHVTQAFKVARVKPVIKTKQLNEGDRRQMAEIVSQITDMNHRYSYKCLEDTKWNLEDALTTFKDLYKLGRIPQEAFDQSGSTNAK